MMIKLRPLLFLAGIVSCCLLLLMLHDLLQHGTDEETVGKLVLAMPSDSSWSAPIHSTTMRSLLRQLESNEELPKQHDGGNLKKPQKKPRRHRFTDKDPAIQRSLQHRLFYNVSSPPTEFVRWNGRDHENFCGGHLMAYAHEFAALSNVIIDRTFCTCKLKGGEPVDAVINQPEADEYYKFGVGCFQLTGCTGGRPSYFFAGENHLNDWLVNTATRDIRMDDVDAVRDSFTIAVMRYEYVNLYHTMTDWYNAFLLMQFFNRTADETNILLVDAHPHGSLDVTWTHLFNSTVRLSALPPRMLFRSLVWGIVGYNSPMTSYLSSYPPLYEEFSTFFMSSFGVDAVAAAQRRPDCARPSIRFIWRRNYVAHPRNPAGSVSRRITNEAEILRYVRTQNPSATVDGLQVDQLDMRRQLDFVTGADILVGMHGAGLTHALFLPRAAAVIELVPSYWSASSEHFEAIAAWRGLVYERWVNNDPHGEVPNQSSVLPPRIVNALIRNVLRRMCGGAVMMAATSE